LEVELHPWGDCGADYSNNHEEIRLVAEFGQTRRLEGGDGSLFPRGMGEGSGEKVGDVKEGCGEENFFHALVLAFDHDEPDDHGADGNGDEARPAKELEAGGDADELGQDIAEVNYQDSEHHEEGDAEAEFFADKIAEAFACDRAHAGGHFLHHDQRKRDRDHGPEKEIAELRPGGRVG